MYALQKIKRSNITMASFKNKKFMYKNFLDASYNLEPQNTCYVKRIKLNIL